MRQRRVKGVPLRVAHRALTGMGITVLHAKLSAPHRYTRDVRSAQHVRERMESCCEAHAFFLHLHIHVLAVLVRCSVRALYGREATAKRKLE